MGSITQYNTTSRKTMKLLVLSALLYLCTAEVTKVVNADPLAYAQYTGYGYPGYPYTTGYGYSGYPYSYTAPSAAPVAPIPAPFAPVPRNLGSQFHAQDELGNLHYGYTNVVSAKQEQGNTYGGVSGGYSYGTPQEYYNGSNTSLITLDSEWLTLDCLWLQSMKVWLPRSIPLSPWLPRTLPRLPRPRLPLLKPSRPRKLL